MPDIYFGLCPNKVDIAAVQQAKPKCILLSYAYWRNHLISDLIKQIGYRPKIMIDSGAFTFYNKKMDTGFYDFMRHYAYEAELNPSQVIHDVRFHHAYDYMETYNHERDEYEMNYLHYAPIDDALFIHYLDWLFMNQNDFDYVVAFDEIGDAKLTAYAFQVMQALDYQLIPAFHLGSDFSYLDELVSLGATYIGLGGMADPKIKHAVKANFVQQCMYRYPNVNYHFFGSLDYDLIKHFPNITSIDGSSWVPTFNERIKPGQTKLTQSICNIKTKEQYNIQLPNVLF